MIGQKISHYQILEKLGEGGMGIVYKAQDTKLNRTVALKFLPQHLGESEPEQARFLQEAQAAAALNHPNICTIYGIHEHDGQQFIEMEYVEGKTLRQLKTQNLELETIVSYAIQIAEALNEAHAKGIVHRDIKADNVMVNVRDHIKVMDFGLAKLKGALRLTKLSSTVGTLAYMAPEQIQGGEADARSDIFSLGVLIFEIMTGKLPFRGDHEPALMYSILNEDPEPAQKYRPEVSSEFQQIVSRALKKSPDDRYQSVGEMLLDLRPFQHLQSGFPSVSQVKGAGLSHRSSLFPASSGKLRIGIGVVSILALIVLLVTVIRRPSQELNPNLSFRTLRVPFQQVYKPAMSLDGNWVAFTAIDQQGAASLFFMNASGGEARKIAPSARWRSDFNEPDLSPDGSQVIYNADRGQINIISSFGGIGRTLFDRGILPRWRMDGRRIGCITSSMPFFTTGVVGNFEFWSINPDGSDKRLEFLDTTRSDNNHVGFSWSPDGRSIAWIRNYAGLYDELVIRELQGGKEHQITFDQKHISDVYWAENDQVFFSTNKNGNANVWMVPSTGGTAVQVTRGTGPDVGIRVSKDGKKLLFLQTRPVSTLRIAGSDGSGNHQTVALDRDVWAPTLSPDRKQAAAEMNDPDESTYISHIFVVDRDGSHLRPVSSGKEIAANAVWSQNGRWIAYSSRLETEPRDSQKVYLVESSNPGVPRKLGRGVPWRWLSDTSLVAATLTSTWILNLNGAPPKKVYEDSTWAIPVLGNNSILFYDLRLDRRGFWLVDLSRRSAKPTELLKRRAGTPYTGYSTYTYPFSVALDGRSFLYVNGLSEVWRMSLPEGRKTRLAGDYKGVDRATFINVSYDGKEVLSLERQAVSKLVMIEDLFK